MNDHNRPPYIELAVADVPISNADKRAILVKSWATAQMAMAASSGISTVMHAPAILIQFHNCRILRTSQIIREDLWVRDRRIVDPEKVFFDECKSADIKVDCHNAIIAPGFIDVQINGAFGIDFSVENVSIEDSLKTVAKGLLAHGVTSFCPTVVTSLQETYRKILPQITKTPGGIEGAGIIGAHVEGPFISHEKCGAHMTEYIRRFDEGFQAIQTMYGSLDNVVIITIAPELARSTEVIESLVKRGITVSLGHSMSDLGQGEAAVRAGASFITHLFNAMLPFHHRDPHLVGLLTSSDTPNTVYYGMIADGIHTHPAALRIAQRSHPKGLVLVTDAIAAMGLGHGTHRLGHQLIEVKENKAIIAGTDTLCGSIATLNECVQLLDQFTGCGQVTALECATLHPAQLLNITSTKGTLDFATDADFVFLDDQLNLLRTYIAGEMVWEKT